MVVIKDGAPNFNPRCKACRAILSPISETVWADVKGKSFEAYYCNNCKNLEEEKDNG